KPGGAERPEDLISRDMVEAEVALPVPPGTRGLEQGVGAIDIGVDELGRSVDRAVDMTFCSEVHHSIGRVFSEDAVDRGAVADIGFDEGVAVRARNTVE